MGKRKSEIIAIKGEDKGIPGLFQKVRIPISLPWDDLDKAMGYCGNDILIDITGVLDELERFKKALWDIKNCQDVIDGEMLYG